jgi:hypothetical protein
MCTAVTLTAMVPAYTKFTFLCDISLFWKNTSFTGIFTNYLLERENCISYCHAMKNIRHYHKLDRKVD